MQPEAYHYPVILRAIVGILCALIVGVGCGGQEEEIASTGDLSVEEYVAAVQELQADAQARFDASGGDYQSVELPTTEQEGLALYKRLFDGIDDAMGAFFDGLRLLEPPAELRTDHDAMVEAGEAYREGLQETAAKIGAASSVEEIYEIALTTNAGAEAMALGLHRPSGGPRDPRFRPRFRLRICHWAGRCLLSNRRERLEP